MDERVEPFLEQGRALSIRELMFSHATYQIEVVDEGESFWPLLHVDSHGGIKDAFCSCEAAEKGCPHVAAAYLKIHATPDHRPLHEHFVRSFFHLLFVHVADRLGYADALVPCAPGHYRSDCFEIEALTPEAITRLTALIEERPPQTPETSIQFSELSAEEITWWRAGRPSASLQFALSFYSDLAKWALLLQFEASPRISYREDDQGLPTAWKIEWPSLRMKVRITVADLIALIPTLDTIESGLKIYREVTGPVIGMEYDPQCRVIVIRHQQSVMPLENEGVCIDQWIYKPGIGFYARASGSLFDCQEIPTARIADVLTTHGQELASFLPVASHAVNVQHALSFDAEWSLHIQAYLFVPGDLTQENLFDTRWAYIDEKGFVPITDMIFETSASCIAAHEMSNFINRYRIFFNMQEGFQTHLASIESHLGYVVTGDGITFVPKMPTDLGGGGQDFGEWMYYPHQGFFSKESRRTGSCIHPHLTIGREHLSSFIKLNRDELEEIHGFFSPQLPLAQRGLELKAVKGHSLEITPMYILKSEFAGAKPQFFGDFVYLSDVGFHELPAGMRLPEGYQERCLIERTARHTFLSLEFPKLEPLIHTVDPALRPPHHVAIHLNYLVRSPKGGIKAELLLVTELGEVAVTELVEGWHRKEALLFTPAGLIDLRDARFSWVQRCHGTLDGTKLEMSMMEFLRFDTVVQVHPPTLEMPHSDVTRMLLKELREGLVSQPLVLRGLKSELRPYQQSGVQWLWFLYMHELSGLLCDDMGLGKTHQAMALMAAILNLGEGKKRRFLIVSPTSVIYHWQDKLKQFLPHVPVHTFHGTKRTLPHEEGGGVLLTSYGILRMHPELWKQLHFDVAIYDEIQVAKNASSQIHETLKMISARMRIGLTGTPIENQLRELKALFDIVLPGYMPSEARFREEFVLPIEREESEEHKQRLIALIRPFVLRRRKREVLDELPEKYEDLACCDLSEEQAQLYTQLLAEQRDSLLVQLKDQKTAVPYMHVFALLSQLKQICNHPALIAKCPEAFEQHASGKWDLFVELVAEARSSEHKIVVFSQYLYMLDIIERYVQKQGWGYAQIRGDTIDRREELDRFATDPECVIFLGSLQAAGLGIDLTAANVVILYDRWWNAARENQAIDRVHRIGQKWAVQVFKLMTKGTIEEKIDRMITRKGRLMEEIITADDQAVVKKLTRSELIELLSYSADES